MGLASSADNIRYNGTGRSYAGAVAGASFNDLGELETLAFSLTQSTEKMKSTRNASRATILEVINEAEAQLIFGLREMTNENLKMSLMAAAINTANQAAGTIDADAIGTDIDLVADEYVDTGYLNVFSTKITGAITGTLATGDTVTQATSGATGKIAFKAATYIELVDVSGVFVTTYQVYKTQDTHYIIPSGVETLEDVVITNAAGTTRRVQGTDYTLDPDYGYVRKLSSPGAIIDTDLISYDYEAVNTKYIHGMSAGSVQKKLIFVSDKDDVGVRTRWTFHKVNILMNGDFPMIGDGAAILSVTASVLKDSTQPSGQEFYKVETIG
jgi:hypothetical protein